MLFLKCSLGKNKVSINIYLHFKVCVECQIVKSGVLEPKSSLDYCRIVLEFIFKNGVKAFVKSYIEASTFPCLSDYYSVLGDLSGVIDVFIY